ncbi:MAG: hypothetical protein IJU34_00040 [Bacteroidales bacterium]|nr:hypothetical protein [Bacteroidales bacterium]
MKNSFHSCLAGFLRLLESGSAPADFPACCRRLHILPGVLDEWLFRELGISGEEILLRWPNLICDWP